MNTNSILQGLFAMVATGLLAACQPTTGADSDLPPLEFPSGTFNELSDQNGFLYNDVNSASATDLGTPTGSATYAGLNHILGDNGDDFITGLTMRVDFDNSNTVTAALTDAITRDDTRYTGTIEMEAGSATADIQNGGTSTLAGATFDGSFDNGGDSIVLNSVTLSSGTFNTHNGTDYLATVSNAPMNGNSSGSFTINGGASNNVSATMYVLEAQ